VSKAGAPQNEYAWDMGLQDFLQQHAGVVPDKPPSATIAAWKAAVSALAARFKEVLAPIEQLKLTDWAVLREYRGVRYNADALTIEFGENLITLEPDAIYPEAAILGRASLNCGVRLVHLDCGEDGQLWRYHWVVPHDAAVAELTRDAIELLVEALIKPSVG